MSNMVFARHRYRLYSAPGSLKFGGFWLIPLVSAYFFNFRNFDFGLVRRSLVNSVVLTIFITFPLASRNSPTKPVAKRLV